MDRLVVQNLVRLSIPGSGKSDAENEGRSGDNVAISLVDGLVVQAGRVDAGLGANLRARKVLTRNEKKNQCNT